MARHPYSFHETIDYIGPRPQKPKKNFFGGWVILVIAVGMAFLFGRPLLSSLKAEQVTATPEAAKVAMQTLKRSGKPGDRVAAAALDMAHEDSAAGRRTVMGAAGVLVTAYQHGLGLDMVKLLHDDMASAFTEYPQLWDERGVNAQMDQTRVKNWERFFHRSTPDVQSEPVHVGDVIFWQLEGKTTTHLGIVVPGPGVHAAEMWVVHDLDDGVKWENSMQEMGRVIGRFRFGY